MKLFLNLLARAPPVSTFSRVVQSRPLPSLGGANTVLHLPPVWTSVRFAPGWVRNYPGPKTVSAPSYLGPAAHQSATVFCPSRWTDVLQRLNARRLLRHEHLRVRRRLQRDHRVARRLERNGLAAPPPRVLLREPRAEKGSRCVAVQRRAAGGRTPGMASGPKWPCPGMSWW